MPSQSNSDCSTSGVVARAAGSGNGQRRRGGRRRVQTWMATIEQLHSSQRWARARSGCSLWTSGVVGCVPDGCVCCLATWLPLAAGWLEHTRASCRHDLDDRTDASHTLCASRVRLAGATLQSSMPHSPIAPAGEATQPGTTAAPLQSRDPHRHVGWQGGWIQGGLPPASGPPVP